MKLTVIQPAMPSYRKDFFRRLALYYGDEFNVYYSNVDMQELTAVRYLEPWEQQIGNMRKLLPGVQWQHGALSIPILRDDLVVVCGAPRNLSTLLLLLKVRMKGARSIWWGHYWTAGASPRRQKITMRLLHLADAVLFYTDSEVVRFYKGGWRHRGLVSGLNNGINIAKINALRESYEPKRRGRELLFIGRLTKKARLELLIEAMSGPNLADVILHVIGGGEQEANLRGLADRNGVASRIIWHGGTTDESRIAEVANRCSLFVYPGQVGLSLIHAMAYGLPCVVHSDQLQQMPEIAAFEDGATGRSFDEGSVASLAKTVSELLSREAECAAMSSRSLEITSSEYNTERMTERFIKFVKTMQYEAR